MPTHCVLRVVDPVSCLVQRVLMRRLQISHPMASLVVAAASQVVVLLRVAALLQVAALPVAALLLVAALHLHQVLALRPLLLAQELQLQLRQPVEQWLQPEEPRLA